MSSSTTTENTTTVRETVSVVANYEIRRVPVGEENILADSPHLVARQNALYATKKITAGTRLICEAPLIEVPSETYEDLEVLRDAFAALSQTEQERYLKLNTVPLHVATQLQEIDQFIRPVARDMAFLKVKENKTAFEIEELSRYGAKVDEAITTFRLRARFHAGCYEIAERGVMAHFLEAAFLRNSCVPNCYTEYNATTHRRTVHAIQDIAVDEELTITKLHDTYLYSAANRANALMDLFGVECKCVACDLASPVFKMQDETRQRMMQACIQLEKETSDIPVFDQSLTETAIISSNDEVNETAAPTATISLARLEAVERLALSILADLKTLKRNGGLEAIWALNPLIERIEPRLAQFPEHNAALRWKLMGMKAHQAMKAYEVSLGKDNDKFVLAEMRWKRVVKAVKEDEERAARLKESRARLGL
jgi:hypothetical protein